MNETNIDVALGYLLDTVNNLAQKHFVAKQELSKYEQNLLNDLHTIGIHAVNSEIIRKHFSIKK